MTFSIAGRCRRTGQFGVAVSTSSICVGARCVWVREGVGVVGTQNLTNPALGRLGLDLLQEGMEPRRVLERMIEADGENASFRQLSVLGISDPPVAFTGSAAFDEWGEVIGQDCVAIGNLLARREVVGAIAGAFEAAPGELLAERLLRGIEAGQAAGGQHGGVHSAALQVRGEQVWPICDLRVDWDDTDPIARLRDLWTEYEPQVDAYMTRALDPGTDTSCDPPGVEA